MIFSNEPEHMCLGTVKWFQVFLTQIILLTINHFFSLSVMDVHVMKVKSLSANLFLKVCANLLPQN